MSSLTHSLDLSVWQFGYSAPMGSSVDVEDRALPTSIGQIATDLELSLLPFNNFYSKKVRSLSEFKKNQTSNLKLQTSNFQT
jgi:hypothetical protein